MNDPGIASPLQTPDGISQIGSERSLRTELVTIGAKQYAIVSDDEYLDGIKNGFEPGMVRLFNSIVQKGHIVLDIGANIGCTAICLAEIAATVHAFEPSPTTFRILERNIQNSGIGNVVLHNLGFGDQNVESELTYSTASRSGGFVSDKTKVERHHITEKIRIAKLDTLIPDLHVTKVHFIKMDVEGFEMRVIRGGLETIRASRPVVVAELNHWCLNAFQRTSVPEYLDFLRSVFPIALAVDDQRHSAINLHNGDHTYHVMLEHILKFRYPNVVCAFEREQLLEFGNNYQIQW